MIEKNREAPVLKLTLEYGKLRATAEGGYEDVWRVINSFLAKVRETMARTATVVSTSGKTVREVLLQLRDSNFFDEPKTSGDAYARLRELGKTDVTSNAVSMALKDLTSDGEMKRKESEKGYEYLAPWAAGEKSGE